MGARQVLVPCALAGLVRLSLLLDHLANQTKSILTPTHLENQTENILRLHHKQANSDWQRQLIPRRSDVEHRAGQLGLDGSKLRLHHTKCENLGG